MFRRQQTWCAWAVILSMTLGAWVMLCCSTGLTMACCATTSAADTSQTAPFGDCCTMVPAGPADAPAESCPVGHTIAFGQPTHSDCGPCLMAPLDRVVPIEHRQPTLPAFAAALPSESYQLPILHPRPIEPLVMQPGPVGRSALAYHCILTI